MSFEEIWKIVEDLFSLTEASKNILPEVPKGTPEELAAGAITHFKAWLSRIGGVVAFIGGVKLALGMRSTEDTEKIQGVTIMVSGFMAIAMVENVDLFAFTGDAEKEFTSLMSFVSSWITLVGGAVFVFGVAALGLALRNSHESTPKVNAVKTMAAGGMIGGIARLLHLFV